MTDEYDWPEEVSGPNGQIELTEEITEDISVTQDMHAGHKVVHEPTGISEEYNVQPYARNANPNFLRQNARRQLVRDNPEILEYYDIMD